MSAGESQGFGNPAAGGVQGAAEGAHLTRGCDGGGHEGAALRFGAVEEASFGVEKLHALLRLVATVHQDSVSEDHVIVTLYEFSFLR